MKSSNINININVNSPEELQKYFEVLSMSNMLEKPNYSKRFQCKIVVSIDFLHLYIEEKKHILTLSNTDITLKELIDIDHDILCIITCFSNQNTILNKIVETLIYGVAAQRGIGNGTILNSKQVDIDNQTHFDFEFIRVNEQNQIPQNQFSITGENIQIHTGMGDNIKGDKKVYNIDKIDKADFS